MKERPSYTNLIERLAFANEKMAFVTGPRQVGKTTLAEHLLSKYGSDKYFNWDDVAFRRQWIKDPKSFIPQILGEKILVVFDELHKAPRWKSYLKGLYDTRKTHAHILVTGSARLDVFRRGGESLLGRYFLFRLHPFSMGELEATSIHPDEFAKMFSGKLSSNSDLYQTLLTHGGFPEPFLKANFEFTNLWRRMRTERLAREDLLDLTRTHELALIETAMAMIPERVGSLFSIQSLAEDLEVSHPTARRWIEWLSQLFYVYRVFPYTKKIARSLKKQPKLYLWDWSEVTDEGRRFENFIAGHLQKAIHFWTDSGIGLFELNYVRDKEKHEVDFLISRDKKPWMLIECKRSDTTPSPHLIRFAHLLGPQHVIQIIEDSGIQESFDLGEKKKGLLISADRFLKLFP
jgi:hypothetical protein